jgi:hypothetical protein
MGEELHVVMVEGVQRLGTLPFPGATRPLDPTLAGLHGAELVRALRKRGPDPCRHLYSHPSMRAGEDYCGDCGQHVPSRGKLASGDRSEQIRRQQAFRDAQ